MKISGVPFYSDVARVKPRLYGDAAFFVVMLTTQHGQCRGYDPMVNPAVNHRHSVRTILGYLGTLDLMHESCVRTDLILNCVCEQFKNFCGIHQYFPLVHR